MVRVDSFHRPSSPGALTKEHHLSRNGGDPRGLAKKHGAGAYNWGSYGEMLNYIDDAPGAKVIKEKSLQLADDKEFAKRKRAMERV